MADRLDLAIKRTQAAIRAAVRERAATFATRPRVRASERACRVCGCTQDHACVTDDGPCAWVEADLCSACARDIRTLDAIVRAGLGETEKLLRRMLRQRSRPNG